MSILRLELLKFLNFLCCAFTSVARYKDEIHVFLIILDMPAQHAQKFKNLRN